MEFDRSKPVLVTGATGYVAGWVVKRLLEDGRTVHAAVRSTSDAKTAALRAIAAALPGTLRFFQADLLVDGSYAEAMAGCEVVIHTASPFVREVRDPQADLVDPALLGTRNVLTSVNRTDSVRRVVLTSSCAAMYGDNADVAGYPGGVITEEAWNTTSTLAHLPYSYSKTVAEKAAWEIAGAQARWDLVTIHPSLVLGPAIDPAATSESFAILRQLGDGRMKMGAPDIGIGVVDVRDVAEAHVRASQDPKARGRYIISGHDASLPLIAKALLPRFAAYPLPRRVLPKWVAWTFGPLVDKSTTRRFVARNVAWPWRADHGKSVRELGMSYRSLEGAAGEMFQQMIDSGQLPKRAAA